MNYLNNKNILNQKGVAIPLIMGSIALLGVVLAQFVYETKLNQIKIYNVQDKEQARLTAESGIKFSLARLKLYKEAINTLNKNEAFKNVLSPQELESFITQPFVYPIPLPSDANLIQRNAVEEFEKNSLLKGKLFVQISAIKGFLNPNLMRIKPKKKEKEVDLDSLSEEERLKREEEEREKQVDEKSTPHFLMEKRMIEAFSQIIEDKRENEEGFDERFPEIDAAKLVKELKYFVTPPQEWEDVDIADIDNIYREKNIKAKHAPMNSLSELHLLQAYWNDEIIDIFKSQMSVHDTASISINDITDKDLKILFPEIEEEQIKEFFKYRDGSTEEGEEQDPQAFKSAEDFKKIITEKIGIVSSEKYDEIIGEFEKAGLKIGVSNKLFKVLSTGEFGRSKYTLIAYIDMPYQETVDTKTNPGKAVPPKTDSGDQEPPPPASPPKTDDKKKKPPADLLEPRIIDITIQ